MIDEFKVMLLGDLLLTTLNGLVKKLDDLATLQTHHMIVVFFLGNFEQRMPTIEIMANHQARRLELSQDAIDRRQTDIFTGIQQRLIDIFGTEVVLTWSIFQDLQDFNARQGDLQARLAQFMVLISHVSSSQ